MNTLSSPTSRGARQPLIAAAAVAFTIVSWASAFPFIRIGLHGLAPLQLAAARFATAALLVIAWLAWRRPPLPTKADAWRFLACGLLGIVNTLPIFTALLAAVFLRERFNRWGWLGSLISLAGIAVIAQGQPGGLVLGSGSTLILGAALCSASYFVLQRRLIPVYGALPCTAYTLLAGAVLLAPWLPGALVSLGGGSRDTAWAVVVLGVFPAALGYATWTFALGYFGAARAASFLYLTPAVATLLSVVLTGERPGIATACGGLLAIAGVVVVALRGRS
ncbi:EamA/RhaT family transporter [Burkholderia cenocepacia]|nr:EamA/RhaT family transporter [Burkholderia cenocepacia]